MTVAEYNYCVNEFADRVYRFVLKNIRNDDTAKDIVQDSYEKLWIRHDEINFSKARSYLFTTAYHTLIDFTRKQKHRMDVELLNGTEMSGREQYSPDLRENLNWALDRIPEIQKTVILLRDYEGYNYGEIGEITGLNESQVKVYIYRGRLALRRLIGNPEVIV
jgi:RNA polymerase sigma-70 factor (ECF subfamily)